LAKSFEVEVPFSPVILKSQRKKMNKAAYQTRSQGIPPSSH